MKTQLSINREEMQTLEKEEGPQRDRGGKQDTGLCVQSLYGADLKQHTRTNLLYDLPHILALPKNSQE